MEAPPRFRTEADFKSYVPVHVVWEITLACDLKCMHCGSRAGHRRPDELTTQECLEVVEALARLGTREISLIGGEAYLRKDFTEIIRAIHSHGIYCAIQTGGRQFTPARLFAAIKAGLGGLGVSLDGLEPLHDRLRGVPGSFRSAYDLLLRARDAGLNTSVNSQIGSETPGQMPELMEKIIEVGASQWQIQLTVAMGNAVDNAEDVLLQPHQLLEVMPLLARLYREGADRNLLMIVGNNIGYFGPYEHLWRGFGNERVHWTGCSAGQTVLALEADGTVKGCPSLATVGFAGGNVRDLTLEQIWKTSPEIHFGRLRSVESLWGFCRTCYYADVCRGGCTWTSHSLLGKPGNNPYCHYRALELNKQGMRERVVKIRDAAKTSFAVGEFELITERISDSSVVSSSLAVPKLVTLGAPQAAAPQASAPDEGRIPPQLDICRNCDSYIWPGEETCPHCETSVLEAAKAWATDAERREAAMAEVRRLLQEAGIPIGLGLRESEAI
jgi:Y-X(10)_GDL-associated radical SAM protein